MMQYNIAIDEVIPSIILLLEKAIKSWTRIFLLFEYLLYESESEFLPQKQKLIYKHITYSLN